MLSIENTLSISAGLAKGFRAGAYSRQADEVKQGKNYLLAVAPQLFSSFQAFKILEMLNKSTYNSRVTKVALGVLIPLAFTITCPIAALVKQNLYKGCIEKYNKMKSEVQSKHPHFSAYLPNIPAELNKKTIKVFCFLSDYSEKITLATLFAASLGLLCLDPKSNSEAHYTGGAVIASLGYQLLDNQSLIPDKISLSVEKYVNPVLIFGDLWGGHLSAQLSTLFKLATSFPFVMTPILHKIDELIPTGGELLSKFDEPFKKPEDLSYREILSILDNKRDLKVNPSHLSHQVVELSTLTQCREFDEFILLFKKINWEDSGQLVLNRLKDDERFIDYLKEEFPEKKQKVLGNLDKYIYNLALKQGCSVEDFAIKWFSEQVKGLVAILKGNKAIKGTKMDLEDSRELCAVILGALKGKDLSSIEKEDIFLKLGIEGGQYCARGIKRASTEIADSLPEETANLTTHQVWERKLLKSLLQFRKLFVETGYDALTKEMQLSTELKQDVHLLDIYRLKLSVGIIPLSKNDRCRFTLSALIGWKQFSLFRSQVISSYRENLKDSIKKNGTLNFTNYIIDWITRNPRLAEEEREHLRDLLSEGEKMELWQNLIFTSLGVLC
ncbi:hypothetical protein AB751O23_BI_00050 [Chlamydiales bacterium SCGC AB-751-O23]|nr:hypothetical protein AB751O23_BI_00050 [Chlamydiales bacterium SCGC AB-751-O23]